MSQPERVEGSLLAAAAHAPFADLFALAPGGVMIIAPHPDDETFGCGMALACVAAAGIPICFVLLTDGEASHPGSAKIDRMQLADLRRSEFEAALSILAPGYDPKVMRLSLPDGATSGADSAEGILERVTNFAQEHRVASVWTTWHGDPHCDHQTAALLGRRLARLMGTRLFEFPVWGRFGNHTVPSALTVFHDCEGETKKRKAVTAYASQVTRLIDDDPAGFMMPSRFLKHFITHPEIFIRVQ